MTPESPYLNMNTIIGDNHFQDTFAEVIVPLPLHGTFTYRLGVEHIPKANIGCRVLVPFGKGKLYTGVILGIHHRIPEYRTVHFIQELLDEYHGIISQQQLDLWQWMSDYYMSPIGEVMHAALPAGLQFSSLTFVEINPEIFWNDEDLSPEEVSLMTIIEKSKKISITALEKQSGKRYSLLKTIRHLYIKDLVLLSEDISQSFKPKTQTVVVLSEKFKDKTFTETHLSGLYTKAKKQYEAILTLAGKQGQRAIKSILEKEHGITPSTISALKNKEWVYLEKELVSRIAPFPDSPMLHDTLTDFQENACRQIVSAWEKKPVVLLHAPTGGGKTHIFIELIRKELEAKRQVLMLIPEIALTKQMMERLKVFFPAHILITHSRYGHHKKTEVWQKVNNGEPCLVLGPRSAALLPFQHLGLTIIDEEHENTYKQFDRQPFFNGRDLGVKRTVDAGGKVLLASATPSLEAWHACDIGKWQKVSYHQQFGQAAPAMISTVSLRSNLKFQGKKSFLTPALDQHIRSTIESGKQILLFQNKKGYVPMIECGQCGWTPKCISCDISLTYYKYSDDLRCHYCGFKQKSIPMCQGCGSSDLRMWGYGTERITEELRLKYPDLQIKRFDQESTKGSHAHENLLQEFEEGKTHILVGTQLIVKGIDFSNVGLCVVISADQLLYFPDFRAHERAWQLIHQLSGRAGRRDGKGHLLIQTGNPSHPVLQDIINRDMEGFIQKEMAHRKELFYPPFTRCIRVQFQNITPIRAEFAAQKYANKIRSFLGNRVLGPEKPHIGRIKNQYIYQLMIKLHPTKDPIPAIKVTLKEEAQIVLSMDECKGTRIIFDVDPQ